MKISSVNGLCVCVCVSSSVPLSVAILVYYYFSSEVLLLLNSTATGAMTFKSHFFYSNFSRTIQIVTHTHIHTNKQRNSAHNAAFNDKSITHFSTVILLFILITCTTSLGTACHWHILLLQFKSFKNSKYGILKGTSWLKMRK